MKNKKTWLKIAKISGVVLIVLCVCALIYHYSDELMLKIFADFPLLFVIFTIAMWIYYVILR